MFHHPSRKSRLLFLPLFTALCLASCKAQETPNLASDDLNSLPASRSVVPQEGNLQSPSWAYNVWDGASKGVLTVGEAPQVGGKAIGLANLGPQPALQLYTPGIELAPGAYSLSFDLFTQSGAQPIIKVSLTQKPDWGEYSTDVADGAERDEGRAKVFIGKPTQGMWKNFAAGFSLGQSAKLVVNLQNGVLGEDNTLWLKALRLVRTGDVAGAPAAPVQPEAATGASTQSTTDPFYRSLLFQDFNALPPGSFLLGNGTEADAADAFALMTNSGEKARLERFTVQGERFNQGLRVTVPEEPADPDSNYWHIFPRADANQGVQKGDSVWLNFWARVVPGTAVNDKGRFQVGVKHEQGIGAQGYLEGGFLDGNVGTEWKRFEMPMSANQSDRPRVEIYCNYKKQTLEFGGFAWVNFGDRLAREQLPAPQLVMDYPGRAMNAPWRKTAAQRIEKFRKGDFEVKVVNANGVAVPGAKVEIEMTRSAFLFGSSVPPLQFPGPDAGGYGGPGVGYRGRSMAEGKIGDDYRALIKENFNTITTGFGWRVWEAPDLRKITLDQVDAERAQGLAIKDHCVLYLRDDEVPDDLKTADLNVVCARLRRYVRGMVTAMKGKVAIYDVLNEPFGSLWLQEKFGNDREGYLQLLADVFKEVKRIDPSAKLFLNDAGQESDADKRQKFLNFAEELIKRGAPIDGFGVQCHFGASSPMPAPEELLEAFDELSRGGQSIGVSEFDTAIDTKQTPEVQQYEADILRDLLTAAFSHPNVDHFTMWGFWDGDHWLHNGPLYNADWSPKPALKVWRQLVLKDWRTQVNGLTNANGVFQTRAFYGDYVITVNAGGKSQIEKASLLRSGQTLQIQLHLNRRPGAQEP